jgi:transcription termination/antitermination protein NusA
VQSIIRELRGEKIDIIEFSEDPVVFATHALSPAKISRVAILSPLDRHMEVIVDDSQLSLAIGKKGQNVRLAAKLLGWRIDIKSEEEKRQEVESAMAALVAPGAPVSVLIDHGLPETVVERLVEASIGTVEKLGTMTPEQLEEIPGVDLEMVEQIQLAVNSYYGQFEAVTGPVAETLQDQGLLETSAAAGEESEPAPPVAEEITAEPALDSEPEPDFATIEVSEPQAQERPAGPDGEDASGLTEVERNESHE